MAASFFQKLGVVTFLLASLPSIGFAQRDEALLAAAGRQAVDAVETTKTLAAIESGSSDATGLAGITEVFERRLKELNFDVRRVTSGFDVKADSLVAVKTGAGTQRVMLMAHMDTVFGPGTLATMPIRQDGNRLYGPGVVDAKGGIAVILHGLEMLRDRGWEDYASITVLFNPDEETGSAGSVPLISSLAAEMDTVLSFEIGGSMTRRFGWVLMGTAAYAQVTMEVRGLSAHAGSDPEQGRNAVVELAHQLLMTKDVANGVVGAQFNWTKVRSDNAFNQIPRPCVGNRRRADTRRGGRD